MGISTPNHRPPALVLGLGPTGLIAIRSLGRKGVPVYGADFKQWEVGRFSKYCRYHKGLSQHQEGEALCQALIEFAEKLNAKPVLYLTKDDYIEMVYPHFQRLKEHFIFSTTVNGNADRFLNKKSFYTLCREHDVELPATYMPENIDEVRSVARDIHYPAIIKPAVIHQVRRQLRGRKVIQVQTSEELISNYERLAGYSSDLIIQEVIPGPDDLISIAACYFDEHSQPKAIFVGRKIRQYPPYFGSACAAESSWDPEIARMSIEFLQRVKFSGLCGTEFKRDPRDGRLKMIEINPRLTLWMGLARAAGIDVAYEAYQRLLGYELPEAAQQVDGVRWIYLQRDVVASLYYMTRRQISLRSWARSLRGLKEEAIIARDDLMTAGYVPFYAAAQILHYLR